MVAGVSRFSRIEDDAHRRAVANFGKQTGGGGRVAHDIADLRFDPQDDPRVAAAANRAPGWRAGLARLERSCCPDGAPDVLQSRYRCTG